MRWFRNAWLYIKDVTVLALELWEEREEDGINRGIRG